MPVPANHRVPLSETPPVLTPFPAKGPAPNDSVLFRLTVAATLAESDRTRVDARPLKPDPSLVSLIVMDVFPEKISAEASRNPWADVNTPVLAARQRVLRELGAPATDALKDMTCKTSIFPIMLGGQKATPHPACPPEGGDYYSTVIALPRQGAAYWPGNLDQRRAYAHRDLYTVRVIQRTMTWRGMAEASHDFVFERATSGTWRLVHKVGLLVVN
jgi:hypothetical protein